MKAENENEIEIESSSSDSIVSISSIKLEETQTEVKDLNDSVDELEIESVETIVSSISNEEEEEEESNEPTLDISLQSDCTISSCSSSSSTEPPSFTTIDYYQDDYSWTESIETFLDRLNVFDYTYDHQSEIHELLDDSGLEQNEEEVAKILKGQDVLVYLAVPVLISQLLLMVILANSGNVQGNNSQLIPIVVHHHHHSYIYIFDEEQETDGVIKKVLYIFFNPFAALFNSKYFKQASAWISSEYKRQLNNPNSCWSQLHETFGFMRKGIASEFSSALRIRDNWNRAVYEKIYKIAASPQYQRTVATVSKWASALKDRIFNNNN